MPLSSQQLRCVSFAVCSRIPSSSEHCSHKRRCVLKISPNFSRFAAVRRPRRCYCLAETLRDVRTSVLWPMSTMMMLLLRMVMITITVMMMAHASFSFFQELFSFYILLNLCSPHIPYSLHRLSASERKFFLPLAKEKQESRRTLPTQFKTSTKLIHFAQNRLLFIFHL